MKKQCKSKVVLFISDGSKVMPPVLQCWPMTSEADVDSMAVEAEPSHLYSVMLCCCVIDGSRAIVW